MTVAHGEGTAEHSRSQRRYFEQNSHRTLKPTGSRYLRRHVDIMCDFAEIGAGDRVLEVGCGLGRYTLLLAERGVAVEGLDLSAQLLEELQTYNAGRFTIPTHALDILDCPPEMENAFDAVVGFFVLHHVHDLDACLRVLAGLVRPGGRVAFVEPNPVNPLYYVQITMTPEMNWQGERGMLKMRTGTCSRPWRRPASRELGFRRFGLLPPFAANRAIGAKVESALEKAPLGPLARPFHLFGGRRPATQG